MRALLAGSALLAALLVAAQLSTAERLSRTPIEIEARPIASFDRRDAARRQFGLLEFRGGLVLTSPSRHFGGLSALRVAADGAHFISVSDKGWWWRGRILYNGARPVGIGDAEMAPMLGAAGLPLAARGWYDAESIAEDGGILYVGIERVHQIVRFNYARDGLQARGEPVPLPRAARSLPANKGLEALVFVPRGLALGGSLIAISERALDTRGNIRGFVVGGPSPGDFAVKRTADYDISDAALLPGGDLLILERQFSWISGLFIRMRRIALGGIRLGAPLDGPVIFEADLRQDIDNMEGLSVHRSAAGEVVLSMISDDNFSMLQRTVLLQFTLAEP